MSHDVVNVFCMWPCRCVICDGYVGGSGKKEFYHCYISNDDTINENRPCPMSIMTYLPNPVTRLVHIVLARQKKRLSIGSIAAALLIDERDWCVLWK